MAVTIAVSGKGGVGKSTLAALIIRHLKAQTLGPILAVDADPNSNLDEQLGLKVVDTIGGIREEVQEKLGSLPPGMTKETFISLRVQECVVESPGLDLLTMGRQEGQGCYCYINHLLRGYLDGLHKQYRYVVVDNEAGMEHLSRRTTQGVDFLLVVSDLTVVGLRAAGRIRELAESLKLVVGQSYLVVNRANGLLTEAQQQAAAGTGLPLLGAVPRDPVVEEFSLEGRPVLDLPDDSVAVQAVAGLLAKVL